MSLCGESSIVVVDFFSRFFGVECGDLSESCDCDWSVDDSSDFGDLRSLMILLSPDKDSLGRAGLFSVVVGIAKVVKYLSLFPLVAFVLRYDLMEGFFFGRSGFQRRWDNSYFVVLLAVASWILLDTLSWN